LLGLDRDHPTACADERRTKHPEVPDVCADVDERIARSGHAAKERVRTML
jgi:hypothetical protein